MFSVQIFLIHSTPEWCETIHGFWTVAAATFAFTFLQVIFSRESETGNIFLFKTMYMYNPRKWDTS